MLFVSAYEPAVFSREVHQKEDTVVSATLETRLEALSLRKQRYPCRSEYVSGNAINLRTNYFEVQTNPNAQLFRYTVSIANLDSKQNRKKRHIIELLLDHPLLRAALPVLATDFVGLIVTAEKLTLERTRGDKDIQEFDIQYKVRLWRLTLCSYHSFIAGSAPTRENADVDSSEERRTDDG